MSDSFERLSSADDGADSYPDIGRTWAHAYDEFLDFSDKADDVIRSACVAVRPELLVMRLGDLFRTIKDERLVRETPHVRTITEFHRELGHDVYLREKHYDAGRIDAYIYDLGQVGEDNADSQASFRLWLSSGDERYFDARFQEKGQPVCKNMSPEERIIFFEELTEEFIDQCMGRPTNTAL